MDIRPIPARDWKQLEQVFEEEFDSDLPDAAAARIYGVYEEQELVGFILTEKILMVGQIWVKPEKRGENVGKIARHLVRFIRDALPDGFCVGAVASEQRFEALFSSLRMQKIEGTFFRFNK